MKKSLKVLLAVLFTSLSSNLYAQNQVKKDTVYYLVDTAKVPVNDRMFLVGQEGDFYGYRLTCECNPYKEDPYFVRHIAKQGTVITKKQLRNIKLITLRRLVHLAVKYGVEKVDGSVFYFIEPQSNHYIIYEVGFVSGRQPRVGY